MGDPAIYSNDFTRLLPGGTTFFSVSSIWVYVYWIVALIIISAISYGMYVGLNRQVAGTLFWILGFFLVYFYYVKWFLTAKKNEGFPTIPTPCPDYLTLVRTPASGNTPASAVCLDFVGVSTNGGLAKCTTDAKTCMQNSGAQYTFPTATKGETVGDLRDRTAAAGLIWSSLLGDV